MIFNVYYSVGYTVRLLVGYYCGLLVLMLYAFGGVLVALFAFGRLVFCVMLSFILMIRF